MTPVFWNLHWQPVGLQVDFSLLLLTYKSLTGQGLLSLISPYFMLLQLRSLGAPELDPGAIRERTMLDSGTCFPIGLNQPELLNFRTCCGSHLFDRALGMDSWVVVLLGTVFDSTLHYC